MSLRYLLRKQSGVPPVGKSGRHFPGCTSVREPQQEPVRVQVPVPLQEPLQEPVQVQVPTDRVKFLEPVRKARMPWIFILVLLISAISISCTTVQKTPVERDSSSGTVERTAGSSGSAEKMERRLADLEIVRERVREELLDGTVNMERTEHLMTTLREDGTWPGINYEDLSRTGFEHTAHLGNMVELARAYKIPSSPVYLDPELKSVIWQALDFWVNHDFISDNWWYNEIGTPQSIGSLLLIMDEDLKASQIAGAVPIMGRASLDALGARPGGDLIQIAGIMGRYALFLRDLAMLDEAVSAIAGEIGFAADRGDPSDRRGLQTDFSFHHRHDRVTSTITYGHGYASYFIDWAEKLTGTAFSLPDESLDLVVDFFLDGISKTMAHGRYPDPGARNRGVTRLGALNPQSPQLLEKLLMVTSYRQEELEALAAIRRGEREPDLRSNTFFWHTEYASHQRPDYFVSVRMFSSRNHSVEIPYNREGLKSHHMADGYTFITRTGGEYQHIFPVWDWQKIPGTTVVQKPALPEPDHMQQRGLTDFVGGVSNGLYGAVAFDFKSPIDSLSARKSWFFFDEEVVALGSDIRSPTDFPVATTLNQSLRNGTVRVGIGDSVVLPGEGEHRLIDAKWVHHDGIGYLFPEPAMVHLDNVRRHGRWSDINGQSWAQALAPVRKDLFTLWLNHGTAPHQAGYAYIIAPGITIDRIGEYYQELPVRILESSSKVQAVQQQELGITQIVFYEPGDVQISDGITLRSEDPGLVMVSLFDGEVNEITVADPTRQLDRIRLEVELSAEPVAIEIDLPQGEYAGQSVVIPSPVQKRSAVFIGPERIEQIRTRIANRTEPTWSAYQALLSQEQELLEREPEVPDVWYVPPFYQDADGHRNNKAVLMDDANTAYKLALLYRLTGETKYAGAAVRFIDAWSGLEELETHDDSSLSFSYHFPSMIFAADLLRGSDQFTAALERRFARFLRERALPMNTMDRENNWGNWGLVLVLASASYLEDDQLFEEGIDRWKYFIEEQIAEDGHLPLEVTRNGGVGERGVWYSHFTLMPQTVAAEIAYVNGADLYGYRSPSGRTLEAAYRAVAPWALNPDEFPWFKPDGDQQQLGTDYVSYFEILNARWPDAAAGQVLERERPTDVIHSAPVLTLTHGEDLGN